MTDKQTELRNENQLLRKENKRLQKETEKQKQALAEAAILLNLKKNSSICSRRAGRSDE